METETPELWKLVFLGVKERPEEAPFMTQKKKAYKLEIEMYGRNSS